MAQAKKCDRCGKLYEDDVGYIPDITVKEYNHIYGEYRYDFCPECQKKLELFLKGENDD